MFVPVNFVQLLKVDVYFILTMTKKRIATPATDSKSEKCVVATTPAADDDYDDQKHQQRKRNAMIRKYICDKINAIRTCNLHMRDLQTLVKGLRRRIGLNKSPKKKGYDKFLTDEERRLGKNRYSFYPCIADLVVGCCRFGRVVGCCRFG